MPRQPLPRQPGSLSAMASTLLVIGIHREELAFGRAVAEGLDPACVEVLEVSEGLPGRHPLPDERQRHDALHRALYQQLPAHMHGHRLLIDLHTGIDLRGPAADLYCRAPERLAGLLPAVAPAAAPRLVRLGGDEDGPYPPARTVIPDRVWQAPEFLYVGLEVYLAAPGAGTPAEQDYARRLIAALARAAEPDAAAA